jgi:hypothetical protein
LLANKHHAVRRVTNLYKANKMIAPRVATKMEPRKLDPAEEPNTYRTMNPPTKAPAMPIRMVRMMPPGSGPGITHFASAPATNPITIQITISICSHLPLLMPTAFVKRHLVRNITDTVLYAITDSTLPPDHLA